MNAVITLVTRNYIHYAINLLESAWQAGSIEKVVLFVVDHSVPELPKHTAPIEIVYCRDLEIEAWHRMTFQYTPFELACSLKPFVLEHALEHIADRVIYLDADIHVYHSLAPLFKSLDTASLVLTPHWGSAQDTSSDIEKIKSILRFGTYNAGFMALRKSDISRRFLDWWKKICKKQCYIDIEGGIYVDQMWLDIVPQLFENVLIECGARYNAAYWNIEGRKLRQVDDQWVVGEEEQPLCFFHFSNADLKDHERLAKTQQLEGQTSLALNKIISEYSQRVSRFEPKRFENLSCVFDTFSSGSRVDPRWREAIRADFDSLLDVENPWDIQQHSDLLWRFRAEELRSLKQRIAWKHRGRGMRKLWGMLKQLACQMRWRSL